MSLFPKDFKGHNLYVWVGSFALILMAWLWIGPKLVQKPAGTPPRSGSNEELKEMIIAERGIPPQPVNGGKTIYSGPMGMPTFRRAFQPLPVSANLPQTPATSGLTAPGMLPPGFRFANRARAGYRARRARMILA